jgi:hypothetical protein
MREHLRCNDCGAIDNDDTGICHAEDCHSGDLAVEVPHRDDNPLGLSLDVQNRLATIMGSEHCDCGAKPDRPHTHGGPSQEARK